ncbi:hypothetical protein Bca4012_088369 [Brassica carinata]
MIELSSHSMLKNLDEASSAKKEVTEKERHDRRENKKSRPSQYPSSSGESTTLRSERSPLGRISEVNEMRREIWNRRRSRRTTQRETTDPYNISVTSPSRKNTSCEFREGRRVLEQ